eukprot:gene2463-2766_t
MALHFKVRVHEKGSLRKQRDKKVDSLVDFRELVEMYNYNDLQLPDAVEDLPRTEDFRGFITMLWQLTNLRHLNANRLLHFSFSYTGSTFEGLSQLKQLTFLSLAVLENSRTYAQLGPEPLLALSVLTNLQELQLVCATIGRSTDDSAAVLAPLAASLTRLELRHCDLGIREDEGISWEEAEEMWDWESSYDWNLIFARTSRQWLLQLLPRLQGLRVEA